MKVRVDLTVDVLKFLQEGHGGWNPRMAEVNSFVSFALIVSNWREFFQSI